MRDRAPEPFVRDEAGHSLLKPAMDHAVGMSTRRLDLTDVVGNDPSGAAVFKSWVASLAAAETGEALSRYTQRLVHPGVVPLAGAGFFGAQPLGRLGEPGHGPLCVSMLHWMDGPDPGNGLSLDQRNSAFGALLTMVTNRRCYLAPELPLHVEGQETSVFVPLASAVDPDLGAPMPHWNVVEQSVRTTLARLSSLSADAASAVSAAIHMHYCAALLATSDLSGAHTLVIGGLEVLAQHFGAPPHGWRVWDQAPGWDAFMEEAGLSETQAQALRARLMFDTHMRLAETFATYVSERVPDSFWEEEVRRYTWQFNAVTGEEAEGDWSEPLTRSQTFPASRRELKEVLKTTYAVRSRFIHAGRRSLSVASELMGTIPGQRPAFLSFSEARLVLRAVVLLELAERGDDTLPNVSFQFSNPES